MRRPTRCAAAAPASPTRPNRPMTATENEKGGALSRNVSDVQNIVNTRRPRLRARGSSAPFARVDDREDGSDQCRVAHRGARREAGNCEEQQDRENKCQPRGQEVYGSPASRSGDESRHGTGDQDPDQDARDDRSDDPAAIGIAGEIACEGNQDLARHGCEASKEQSGEQHSEGGWQGTGEEGGSCAEKCDGHKDPAIQHVAQRHEQQDADRVADLGGRHEPASRTRPCLEVGGDEVEQWL